VSAPLRKPRVGDRVHVSGFKGTFEIIRVTDNGVFADLKLLDATTPGTEYIERDVPLGALLYLDDFRKDGEG
jgi:hypothetical protein